MCLLCGRRCKEGLHETLDLELGMYFKWISYLCLSLWPPQAADLKRQQWQERVLVQENKVTEAVLVLTSDRLPKLHIHISWPFSPK